jgi:methyl coenzyme M reductase subunit D
VQEDPVTEEEKTPEDRKVAEQHRTEVLELSSRIGELDIEIGNKDDKIAHLQEMLSNALAMM